jgi:hypothetical protein
MFLTMPKVMLQMIAQIDRKMVLVIWQGGEALEALQKNRQNELILELIRETAESAVVWMPE